MKAQFLLSTLSEFPLLKDPKGELLPEIALAGRSNVGKSSLINHLFNKKKLAKFSAAPGKTQLINFFSVDEQFLLVDLPGYGFAKAPLEEKDKWSQAIDTYLNSRKTLKLILLLVDCRRKPNQEDLALIEWAAAKQIPLLLILTKTDKLSNTEKIALMKKNPEALLYSITDKRSRSILEKRIGNILWA